MNHFAVLTRPLVDRPGVLRTEDGKPARSRVRHAVLPPIPNPWGLTYAQAQVLQLLADGMTFVEAALALGVSTKCIDHRAGRIKHLMRVRNLTQATVMWDRHIRGANQ